MANKNYYEKLEALGINKNDVAIIKTEGENYLLLNKKDGRTYNYNIISKKLKLNEEWRHATVGVR